ncbi:MAG: glutamine--fructose-6-phosphate transaminase (isomerizing) [Tepidimonas sp.]|uniref:glutamine--fructose-6-phosphate transaminase (isomerizing) n=1 Tax=Tepidimonas sp. TaxID=2002775 RepID=UPI00298ED359|nr:glutamine--fructose-6-phosphate transaminase (isomerizing) [Tepidimonas sp.]MDW8336679.1 glutamine--fructose-6-phosphate transaminase (isomerizing) [Tepidimonas sp.]
MCGIVGAVACTDIVSVLLQGLQRLEYRGYDSCGLAVHQGAPLDGTVPARGGLWCARSIARVADLAEQVHSLRAATGIAHTRWATHGAPTPVNAHPQVSYGPAAEAAPRTPRVALVHNGIIENHAELREQLQARGYRFESQTDTEVIAHLIDSLYEGDLADAVLRAVRQLQGAYAIAVLHHDEPQRLVGARAGSPLVLGVGQAAGGQPSPLYLASDALALAGVTDQFVFLAEGDVVDLQLGRWRILDRQAVLQEAAARPLKRVQLASQDVALGPYRHYMQKEIFEQPRALADTLEGVEGIVPELFDDHGQRSRAAWRVFDAIDRVLILACGTSHYAGCVARYWLEALAGVPTAVEIASEYRYRCSVADPRTLVVAISQSGETADTLAALRHAQTLGMHNTLAICNVATSALVRECELAYVTRAGVEIGVASTKAFTTQLAALFLLTLVLAQAKGRLTAPQQAHHLRALRHLPVALQGVLALEPQVIRWAEDFASKEHALFLGRGAHYPIALEGALKLKEISYIHAEGYPAGELKHGPLALVTSAMPVVAVAPNDALLDKLKSNLQEVRARGGVLYVLADADTRIASEDGVHVIRMPEHYGVLSPILHVVPLQLLAYHTACLRGTDVDKPRNLAKSVTVE